jgi:RNA polymerase sigma factor (sigma-70 family)
MDAETGIGGSGKAFPQTRHSIVLATKSVDATIRYQAFDALIAVYWKPVYKYIRMKWMVSAEDAQDLTQEFFAVAFEKDFFESYDARKSKFRTFLRTCVDGLVANARKAATRIKRGGQNQTVALDFEAAENELSHLQNSQNNLEEFFDREWVRSLFSLAVDDLRQQCQASAKLKHFALFERYDLDADNPTSYAELAREFQVSVTQVTNYLAFARSEFRRHVLNRLRRITGSDAEFRSEARRLLGIDSR